MKKVSVLCILAALSVGALQTAHAAKIYTCVINGQTVYTSKAGRNCSSADLPPIGRYSTSRYDTPSVRSAESQQAQKNTNQNTAKAKPAAVPVKRTQIASQAAPVVPAAPKVSSTGGRRSILEQELANERQALANEQKALAAARTAKSGNLDQQHISRLQGSVLDRQQNIQALQRELSRI
ncbi:hypothetical protein PL75_02645 [Neisseria arctica]|uniref:Periplasmic protein n=1 Tax=Neisseria arctica TaxID=1470200 RepID=A0A0J0YTX9_9NEIS|nr:hypothetical protein [Neisseria arctica]KLT73564.1 hypothetical protein PL75_02645 [Neisseria arctica]UOO86149.1 hypothetical protein LVJ86_07950 [Neisseria arctica]